MGAAVVMLREGFEASLVIGIVLAFLSRTGRRDAFATVWVAAAAAAALSLAAGSLLFMVGSELEGKAEAAWEAATMLAAAALLTWMIFWMRRQARTIKRDLERDVERALARGSGVALALVVFVGVLREGVESALFLLGTVEGADALTSGIGAAAGLAAAALGVLVYRGSSRLDLRRFFSLTSALLLVFAAYLLASGLHELEEAGILPESEALLAAAFVGLAAPTLYALFRRPKRVTA
jgi:high-affinity iron transporter